MSYFMKLTEEILRSSWRPERGTSESDNCRVFVEIGESPSGLQWRLKVLDGATTEEQAESQ